VIAKADPPPTPRPAPSIGFLTVKEDTSLADAKRAWDAAVAKGLQEEARKRAEFQAKGAAGDAQIKALIEKQRQERVKRGRRQ
jgi:hypothetical protein